MTIGKKERKRVEVGAWIIVVEGGGGGSKIILNMAHFGECLPRLAPETGFVSAHCLCQ